MKQNRTKQKPVAELSGFCYTSIKGLLQQFLQAKMLLTSRRLQLLGNTLSHLRVASFQWQPFRNGDTYQLPPRYLDKPLTRFSFSFIFQRTLRLFQYKYSKLTNTCQNCIIKSRKIVLNYQHIISTNLSKCVHAPIYFNTLLTKSGVMVP